MTWELSVIIIHQTLTDMLSHFSEVSSAVQAFIKVSKHDVLGRPSLNRCLPLFLHPNNIHHPIVVNMRIHILLSLTRLGLNTK